MSAEAAGAARQAAVWATSAETAHAAAVAQRATAEQLAGSRDPVQQAHVALMLSQVTTHERDRDARMGLANMWAAVSGALLNVAPGEET
ncbi:hypothetical protein ACFQ6U_13870 [Streptomyces sp. NPDC056465]|uniref:hypothetical protein n=1 Tax=unclassified Streptomyces TaxID=2593676 RepID=UPI0035D58974